MDPMDFTMDDSSNVLTGSTLRYQCQQPHHTQPHPQTNGPNFPSHGPSQIRDNQHYDPVHESSGWYQHNHPPFPPRPPTYPTPQWSSVPQTEPAVHNWPNFADMDRRNPDYNSPEYRRSFMPWSNESRGFEGFNHPGYAPAPVNTDTNVSTEPPLQFRSQASLRGYAMDSQQQQFLFSRDMARASLSPNSATVPSHATLSESRPPQASGTTPSSAEPSTTTPQLASFAGVRPGFSRGMRPGISRHEDILEGSRRRRLAASWDSDDDEESLAEIDRIEVARRNAAEALFGGEFDEERSIAALRGAVAGGKRVPSKEALESLETIKVADLKDADRTCIICYNEFGVRNPEGETENPIRLPKCKHIFGDRCIKKWFEDSDSCPYCRDKLPSELAVRKTLGAYQSYRLAHREQVRLATLAQRSRYSSYTPAGVASNPIDMENHRSALAAQRIQEDYEFLIARQAESWSYSPPNRNPNADSPERRRQVRGRHNAIRGQHFLGRPTSVGSARAPNPSFTHPSPRNFVDLYGPRRNVTSEAAREVRERESRASIITSAVSPLRASWDQITSEASGSASINPTPPPVPTGASVPGEEASPPVAVGSGQQADQRISVASGLNVDSDNSDFMFDLPSNPRSHQSHREGTTEARNQRQIEPSTGVASFGSLLDVGNTSATRFGPDPGNRIDDLARINRMDAGIPPGWGSIN